MEQPAATPPSSSKLEEARRLFERCHRLFDPRIKPISASEVVELECQGKQVVLVDVRCKAERDVSMLPGALTQDEFEKGGPTPEQVGQGDGSVIVVPYCTIGYRSGKYCQSLLGRGYAPHAVRNSEGIVLWTHHGPDLVTKQQPNKAGNGSSSDSRIPNRRVHTYGRRWDLAADGYETEQFGLIGMAMGALGLNP